MKNKYCMALMLLFAVEAKGELSIVELFQALISSAPMSQALLPVSQRAHIDVHMLSRFLKELADYPSILMTDTHVDEDRVKALFPNAVLYLVAPEMQSEALIKQAQDFIETHGAHAVVLTNLASSERALDLWQDMPKIRCLSVDALLAAEDDSMPVDMQKLLRLMKRKIRVVCTAALIPIKFEHRMQQYIRSLNALITYGYHPYIVESCLAGPTFLDDCSRRLCYTLSNNANLKNKGVNESVSLLKALEVWNFDDTDIILKLTGRYLLQTDDILRMLEDREDIDALAKFAVYISPSILTGCYAMRCDLMKQMYASYDYDRLEREMICIEHEVGAYLDARDGKELKLMRVDKLGVEANWFYTNGSDAIQYW